MSKRLQVLLPDKEMAEIRRIARRQKISVGEWVRRSLRAAVNQESKTIEAKLEAIRKLSELSLPTADIRQMIQEIEQGYLE